MKKTFLFFDFLCAFCSSCICIAAPQEPIEPDGSYMFTKRDTCDLFLDVYDPAGDSLSLQRQKKPTILFVFGGGFVGGERSHPYYQPWFRRLNADGYRVVTIDYRLGLKGVENVGIRSIPEIYNAVEIGVEDLYSATAFLCNNADALGVDPGNIVICGSSAGAIICMQADWHLCNDDPICASLPEGFRYKGVISFAGAVFSRQGKPSYKKKPAPTLFFHGTADKIVRYNRIWFFKNRFGGASYMAKIFRKNSYPYRIYRFKDAGHEIASAFMPCYGWMQSFLEDCIMKGEEAQLDTIVTERILPPSRLKNLGDLYD